MEISTLQEKCFALCVDMAKLQKKQNELQAKCDEIQATHDKLREMQDELQMKQSDQQVDVDMLKTKLKEHDEALDMIFKVLKINN
jgi:peptidoglycan hydrolase CwlO-like protein